MEYFLKKKYFMYLKVKRSQKIVWGLLTEFTSLTQNPKKIIGTPNQPIKIKNFLKKSLFSNSKVKRSQKFV
jgi:hypothetical protein